MGCNIHIWVERKDPEKGWVPALDLVEGFVYDYSKPWGERLPETNITRRHYALFAELSGVRAYDGESGVFSGRGLPPDCNLLRWSRALGVGLDGYAPGSDEHRWLPDDADADLHNFGWATLAELREIETDSHLKTWATLDHGDPDAIRVVFAYDN